LRKVNIVSVMFVCPFVRPSLWNNSAPTGRIFVTSFLIWVFSEVYRRDFKFHQNLTWITAVLHEDLCTRVTVSYVHVWQYLMHTCESIVCTRVKVSCLHVWQYLMYTRDGILCTRVKVSYVHVWKYLMYTYENILCTRVKVFYVHVWQYLTHTCESIFQNSSNDKCFRQNLQRKCKHTLTFQ